MKKKHIIIGVSILLLARFVLFYSVDSPHDYLRRNKRISESIPTETLVYCENLNSKTIVLFCKDDSQNLSCTVLEKRLWNYKVRCISSGLTIKIEPTDKAQFIYSSFINSNQWIDWGVIYDQSIKTITSNNSPGNIVPIGNYSLYFFIGADDPAPPNHNFIYH